MCFFNNFNMFYLGYGAQTLWTVEAAAFKESSPSFHDRQRRFM
jgi:hypothetical protein